MVKSVYIHIPFCKNICSYCDFCKMFYKKEYVDKYLEALEKEIKQNYKKEKIKTLYIGGGTPSCLTLNQLKKLFKIIKIFEFEKNSEFTFECNIEDITYDKMSFLYNNNVNRISIGVESFDKNNLLFLNRKYSKKTIIKNINIIKQVGFKNINVDLIYAIPNQTLECLKQDIQELINLDITHVSVYSLIIEPNTKLYIKNTKNIDEDLDYKMYKLINKTLIKNGFKHYEISNYSKKGYESKHNLTYWNNEEYYGFGLGASGYINNIRYQNTRGFNKYLEGNYILNEHKLSLKEQIENEYILGFRKIKGINKTKFEQKYGDIKQNKIITQLIQKKELKENKNYIYINSKYMYTQNQILVKLIE